MESEVELASELSDVVVSELLVLLVLSLELLTELEGSEDASFFALVVLLQAASSTTAANELTKSNDNLNFFICKTP
ncbi:hypothetical protein LCGT_0737 [Lactococcus garvieae ATCC 49156]|uniref:Uncharacterized protein n=1 Tax=Lactococcus garvieae (strain Lg2) TaxID=420890 RepID=F9VD16_LACGL|nr:hypothetical protein LCGT_0737 [Lactococcus garvieae ATCC 49156]BAK60217.1 hypothetical protein LCGL_0757 [Lactococcus garvieae Lg2]